MLRYTDTLTAFCTEREPSMKGSSINTLRNTSILSTRIGSFGLPPGTESDQESYR